MSTLDGRGVHWTDPNGAAEDSWALKWDRIARDDPEWIALSDVDANGQRKKWNREEFLSTGEAEIAQTLDAITTAVPDISFPRTRALDFGCGPGRLTRALGNRFEAATGVDVSERMLEKARLLNADRTGLQFIRIPPGDLSMFTTGEFDFVYSRRVLQHLPRRLFPLYVSELLRVTGDNGLLAFQYPGLPFNRLARLLPSGISDPLFNDIRRARRRISPSGGIPWEMHFREPRTVGSMISDAHGNLLAMIRLEPAGGGRLDNWLYVARRRVYGT